MGKLEGKTAVITGRSSRIGLATARRFVEEGAYVFIIGRRKSELSAAIQKIGRNVTGVQGDVSKLGDLDRLFDRIQREKGRLDVAIGLPAIGASRWHRTKIPRLGCILLAEPFFWPQELWIASPSVSLTVDDLGGKVQGLPASAESSRRIPRRRCSYQEHEA